MKNSLIIALISIGITGLISTLFGYAGSTIVGTFWSWFIITFLIQIIGFAGYNSYLIQKDNIALQQAEVEALEQFSKFSVKISCAYCHQSTVTPIQLNQRNTFKCENCNQVNGVSMQFIATTLTTPIQSINIPTSENNTIEFKVT